MGPRRGPRGIPNSHANKPIYFGEPTSNDQANIASPRNRPAFWGTFDARKVVSPTATLIRDSPSDNEPGAGGLILINSRFERKSQEIFAIAA